MVERNADKKIRVLREVLTIPAPSKKSAGDKGPRPATMLSTDSLKIPRTQLSLILAQLGLTISSEYQDPFGSDFGIDKDYLLEVAVEPKDIERLSPLLKKYEAEYPKRKKSLIREKTLELIARKMGDLATGPKLEKFLKDCGVDEELVIYPNTKWRMIFDALVYLANSARKEDQEALSKAIGEATHPLMHEGNKSAADALRNEFDDYLNYDNFGIAYDKAEGTYWALRRADDDEADIQAQIETDEMIKHYEEQSEKQLAFLCKPENKEKISLLRKAYQQLMNVVFFFCEDPTHPTVELNQNFQYLYKLINTTINELGLWQIEKTPFSRNEHFFYLPFSNLFSAEKVYEERGKELGWQQIRPEMNAMYGDIEEIYQEINGSDVLAEPDKQEKLNEIQLALSVLKKKRETAKKMQSPSIVHSVPTQRIEITAMPKLQVENVGANAHPKDRKRESPIELSLPEPVQWKKVTLKIKEGKQEIEILYDNSHIITADYRQLRFFVGKKQQKPDRQWGFLCALATLAATDIKQATAENMRRMITQDKMLSANNVQQVKKLFVERLQDIFKTSDDPFHDKREYYEPKFKILPEPALRREKIWSPRLHENRSHEPKFIADQDNEMSYEDNEEEAL